MVLHILSVRSLRDGPSILRSCPSYFVVTNIFSHFFVKMSMALFHWQFCSFTTYFLRAHYQPGVSPNPGDGSEYNEGTLLENTWTVSFFDSTVTA